MPGRVATSTKECRGLNFSVPCAALRERNNHDRFVGSVKWIEGTGQWFKKRLNGSAAAALGPRGGGGGPQTPPDPKQQRKRHGHPPKTRSFRHRTLFKHCNLGGFGQAKVAKRCTGRIETVFFSSWPLTAAPVHRFPSPVWLLGARPLANTALGVVFEPTLQKHEVLAIGRRRYTVKYGISGPRETGRRCRLRCCSALFPSGGPPGTTERLGNPHKTGGSRRPPPPLTLLFRPFAYNWLRRVFLRFFRSRPNLAQGVSKRCFSALGRSPPPRCNQ